MLNLFVGIFSTLLTVACGLGGLLYGLFGRLPTAEKTFAYTFWIFPAIIAMVCFREYAKRSHSFAPPPKAPDDAEILKE